MLHNSIIGFHSSFSFNYIFFHFTNANSKTVSFPTLKFFVTNLQLGFRLAGNLKLKLIHIDSK